MNKFDEREKSFEKKFQMEQELQFKVQARSNKYLAEFVSSKLGKTDEEKKKLYSGNNQSRYAGSWARRCFSKNKKGF